MPEGKPSPVTAVVIHYGSVASTRRALASLRSNAPGLPVVVVDNDGALTEADGEGSVRRIRPGRNLGYGASCNLAVGAISSNYVLLMNNDVEIQPGTVGQLTAILDREPAVAAVAPRLYDSQGRPLPSIRRMPTPRRVLLESFFVPVAFPGIPLLHGHHTARISHSRPCNVETIEGAVFLVRRSAFLQVDGFDEQYFHFFEETDLFERLRRRGWLVRFEPSGAATHHGGVASSSFDQETLDRWLHQGFQMYARRFHGPAGERRTVRALVAGARLRWLLSFLPIGSNRNARRKRFAAIGRMWRGERSGHRTFRSVSLWNATQAGKGILPGFNVTRTRPPVLALAGAIWRHPGNRGRRLRALCRATAWQLSKRVTRRHWDLRMRGSPLLRCYPDSTCASSFLYFGGRPEFHEMEFLAHYLRPGDGFLDIGANIGMYTLLASSVTQDGPVDAFEPSPREAFRLRENIALNGLRNARVHEEAAGRTAGPIPLDPGPDDQSAHVAVAAASAGSGFVAACVRLDDKVAGNRYAMGKIDIEGTELMALQGAERMLAGANPPVWLVEMNGLLHEYGLRDEDLSDWMGEQGYDVAIYDADARSLHFGGRPWEFRDNVLFIATRYRNAVEARIRSAAYQITRVTAQ